MASSARDYRAVASIIASAPLEPAQRALLIVAFSDHFRKDNPRFDRARFGEAATPR